jgi:hypothetical protein
MKWHADSYFEIGAGHKVCQDYATHSEKKAVLSDGCSSMPDTDIGARLICKNELAVFPLAMDNLVAQASFIGIPLNAFHATRMQVRLDDQDPSGPLIRVDMEGDGYLIVRGLTPGDVTVLRIEFHNNAPWYPIYQHTLTGYHRFVSVETHLTPKLVVSHEDCSGQRRIKSCTLDARLVDFVAVCSDGLGTFTDSNGTKQHELALAYDLADVKIVSGEFIKRRVGALKRKNWAGLSHDDDFSIAVLARSEA